MAAHWQPGGVQELRAEATAAGEALREAQPEQNAAARQQAATIIRGCQGSHWLAALHAALPDLEWLGQSVSASYP